MKRLSIISLGLGGDSLTLAAKRALGEADALLGAPRLLALAALPDKPAFPAYAPGPVLEVLKNEPYERFCLLVSGDAGFYSASEAILNALPDGIEAEVFPGISSLNAFFARLRRPWQSAAIVSCHGRNQNLADTVRRNETTFALTGGNLASLGEALISAGYGHLTATVGENLGLAGERIQSLPVSELSGFQAAPLAVLLIDNPGFDPRVRFGIPDGEFIRGNVPMTKSEVRAVTLSRLALSPDAICYDVGAGTGSVTVEMALSAHRGLVYAVDREAEALRLVRANCAAFHIGNVIPVSGSAPEALTALPPPDAVFIGGSGGNLSAIFDCILTKNPLARIVVNAVALESAWAALAAFSAHGIEPELIQLGISRGTPAGKLHLLTAGNPIFILSGGGHV